MDADKIKRALDFYAASAIAELKPRIERGWTWSEQYKRHCLVQYVMRLPRAERKAFYRAFAEHHGAAAAHALAREVKRAWQEEDRG